MVDLPFPTNTSELSVGMTWVVQWDGQRWRTSSITDLLNKDCPVVDYNRTVMYQDRRFQIVSVNVDSRSSYYNDTYYSVGQLTPFYVPSRPEWRVTMEMVGPC